MIICKDACRSTIGHDSLSAFCMAVHRSHLQKPSAASPATSSSTPIDSAWSGQEINANHVRAVSKGFVIGTARPLHLGKRSQVWEIRIEDEANASSASLASLSPCWSALPFNFPSSVRNAHWVAARRSLWGESDPRRKVISKTFRNMDVFARAYMDVLAAFLEMTFRGGAIEQAHRSSNPPRSAILPQCCALFPPRYLGIFITIFLLTACGLKGPLRMPEQKPAAANPSAPQPSSTTRTPSQRNSSRLHKPTRLQARS